MKTIALFLIRIYQLAISPWLGHNCRFHPTCSEYARQSFLEYSAWQALKLTLRRLFSCHPWHGTSLFGDRRQETRDQRP